MSAWHVTMACVYAWHVCVACLHGMSAWHVCMHIPQTADHTPRRARLRVLRVAPGGVEVPLQLPLAPFYFHRPAEQRLQLGQRRGERASTPKTCCRPCRKASTC